MMIFFKAFIFYFLCYLKLWMVFKGGSWSFEFVGWMVCLFWR